MNLPLFIARRYLISKKKQNIINLISAISALGVATGTFALVVVMSVFNGFNHLIESYLSELDPDLKITSAEGKRFDPHTVTNALLSNNNIFAFSEVIEENALLKYGERQFIATVKGVPPQFAEVTGINDLMLFGDFMLNDRGVFYAVPGQGVAAQLGIGYDLSSPIHIYVPKPGGRPALTPGSGLNHDYIYASGIFALLEEVDAQLVLVPLAFASRLFDTGNEVSAIELKIHASAKVQKVQKMLQQELGDAYEVKNKYQQHDMLYKTMKSEKWATYLILIFILMVASFNILGSLSMLIIDKKSDIAILRSMGANSQLIHTIFLIEGWLISLVGIVVGVAAGVTISLLQIQFGWITLPGSGSFVVSAYPVKIVASDLLMIFGAVSLIGFLASWYPVRFIAAIGTDQNQ